MTAPARRVQPVSIDLVIPVFNEAAVLRHLIERLESTFTESACASRQITAVRFLIIDDGRGVHSQRIIREWIHEGANATLLCLSRNFGHQAAVSAGLDHTSADIVVVIDF